MEEPDIKGVFFKYGLELKDELPHYNNTADGTFSFDIICKNGSVRLSCQLRTLAHQDVSGGSKQSKQGNIVTFSYDVPDEEEYRGLVFARFSSERKIWDRIPVNRYEQDILPKLETLLENKKITAKEKDYFINSYYKIELNEYYYFFEDQFDTDRNNAVRKIHPLVNLPLDMLGYVLRFNIKAGTRD